MKREIVVRGNKLIILYRIIVAVVLLLVVLLVAGSLYALIRSRDSSPLFRIGGAGGREGQGAAAVRDDSASNIFSGIGTMRIPNAGKQAEGQEPAIVIVSISFPYKADDRPFTEELASHIVDFRSIATNYFANLPRDKLAKLNEEQVKAELLKQYNALLRLGRIETLYFADFMIVD